MKTKNDPRHLKRIKLLKALYAQQFTPLQKTLLKEQDLITFTELNSKMPEINSQINHYALKFATEKMAKMDLAILQLGVYELVINNQAPYKVVVDECIELAKEYGAVKSPNFINGVLGKIVEDLKNG